MPVLNATTGAAYPTLSAAIAASATNDVLQVPAGRYIENFPDIAHNLTITAVDGMAVLSNPQPMPPNGRAVLNVPFGRNVSLSVSGLEIHGAANEPGRSNGAGILFESGNGTLTVTGSYIHHNQDGILTGGTTATSAGGMHVVIDHCEIADNGVDQANRLFGYDHNIYAGRLASLAVRGSYIHDARGGHEIKSRAQITDITGNRIQDGPDAPASYAIDLPNGGVATITGNVIEKGQASTNDNLLHFGGEQIAYTPSSLTVGFNVLISNRPGAVFGLLNEVPGLGTANVPVSIWGNVLYGIAPANIVHSPTEAQANLAHGNTFVIGQPPMPDRSPGYGLPEPSDSAIFLGAALVLATVRARRRRTP